MCSSDLFPSHDRADYSLNLRDRPPYPTIFELYRKHNEPERSAINAWWISHSNNLYPILNYSNFPGYGAQFAANQLSPTQLFSFQSKDEFDQMLNISSDVSDDVSKLKNFLNNGFKTGGLNLSSGVANTPEDTIKIQSFITKMYNELNSGLHNDPWAQAIRTARWKANESKPSEIEDISLVELYVS